MNEFNKIILFGTFDGVMQILENIDDSTRIVSIVGPSIRPSELKLLAKLSKKIDIPLITQPKQNSLEYKDFILQIQNLNYDSIISNCYSMIIRPDVLMYCNYNAINIHWSLLPLNRGPNPIQWSLIKNEKITGATIHFIDDGLDTGDIIEQEIVNIKSKDTWVNIKEKLILVSNLLIKETLPKLFQNKYTRRKQNELIATKNSRLNSDFPKINFSIMNDLEIYNLIRAQVKPLTGAYLDTENERIYFSDFLNTQEVNEIRKKYEK